MSRKGKKKKKVYWTNEGKENAMWVGDIAKYISMLQDAGTIYSTHQEDIKIYSIQ